VVIPASVEIDSQSTAAPETLPAHDHAAYVLYTSGSTGVPNGVIVEHRALLNFCLAAIRTYGLTAHDRVLQFATLTFDSCLEELFPALMTGGTVVVRSVEMLSTVAGFIDGLRRLEVTVASLPTAYWHLLCDALPEGGLSLPPTLRLVIVGGERAQKRRLLKWHEHVGQRVQLLNTYGPTEATVVATACDLTTGGDLDLRAEELPIGRPIGNVQAYVLDPQGEPAPVGVAAELYLGGMGLARGYLNRPELTAARFVANPFGAGRLYKTGDRVRWRCDGLLEFVGRIDEQVKLRGFRVEPGEIESALMTHPGVRAACVVARQNTSHDLELAAYIVPSDPAAAHAEDWSQYLSRRLPAFMIPATFLILDSLPLTPHGKVDRAALPAPQAGDRRHGQSFVPPRTPIERMLAGIWRELLGVERVGRQDDFFALGGHSLLAIRMLSRLRTAFDIELPLDVVFQRPTVGEQALAIDEALCAVAGAVPRPHNSLEAALFDVIRTVLRRESVSPEDNFFDAGGDSLHAARLVALVKRELGVEIPLRSVFESPTIASLVQLILQQRGLAEL
jgi:amino acid adenylation domain-containing protein